ncbi:MAG TPA: division/cell wall cluster transcriptional repressor MraZ [Bacteroidia bacterium]|jgi:MraZ protein|nr:division/cell wall cluster transcriptional repressor MraZ [Bacteroidia bacterium]
MAALIGEYECKLDDKGRLMLPVGLKKQLPSKEQKHFVVNRGLDKQLNLWPKKEWHKETASFSKLNLYKQKDREFVRRFNAGATEVELDGSGRLLLPKSLMEYAGVEKDAVLFGFSNRIEIWSKQEYNKYMKQGADDFAALAEEVMGKIPNDSNGDVS